MAEAARQRGVIRVEHRPHAIPHEVAWVQLRGFVLKRHGMDIDEPAAAMTIHTRPCNFGNYKGWVIVAWPRSCRTPQDVEQTAVAAYYGEMTPGMERAARDVA